MLTQRMDSPQAKNSTSRASRKEVPAFLHDATAEQDWKMQRLLRIGGEAYYGRYWRVLERMRLDADLCVSRDAIDDLSFALRVERLELETFLDLCIEIGLFEEDAGIIFSPSLIRRIEAYEGARESKRVAGRRGGLAKAAKSEQALLADVVALPSTAPSTASGLLQQNPSTAKSVCSLYNTNTTKNELEQKPKSNGKEPAEPKPPDPQPAQPPQDPHLAEAETLLETPTGSAAWEKSNLFIGAGRRPLKKHPEIFFQPGELASVLRQLDKTGLPRDAMKDGVAIALAELSKRKAKGERVPYENVVGWFMGFIPDKLAERQIKKQLLEKTKPNARVPV